MRMDDAGEGDINYQGEAELADELNEQHANWPKAKTFLAMLKGTAEVFTPTGFPHPLKGVKSASEWIFAGYPGLVVCALCGEGEKFPPPPVNQSFGEEPTQLFGVQTISYANYLLTTLLNPFYKTHLACLVEAAVIEEPDVESK